MRVISSVKRAESFAIRCNDIHLSISISFRFPPTVIPPHPWSGPPHFDAGWSRGPFHEHMGNGYRGIGDRLRRPEDDPRLVFNSSLK